MGTADAEDGDWPDDGVWADLPSEHDGERVCPYCGRAVPAGRGPLCRAHEKRKERGRPMNPPIGEGRGARYASSMERLAAAAVAMRDADTDDDRAFQRARARLWQAAHRAQAPRESRQRRKRS